MCVCVFWHWYVLCMFPAVPFGSAPVMRLWHSCSVLISRTMSSPSFLNILMTMGLNVGLSWTSCGHLFWRKLLAKELGKLQQDSLSFNYVCRLCRKSIQTKGSLLTVALIYSAGAWFVLRLDVQHCVCIKERENEGEALGAWESTKL